MGRILGSEKYYSFFCSFFLFFLVLQQILGNKNTILSYQYRASTQLGSHSFDYRLENEPRVGTPIRRNLYFRHFFGPLFFYFFGPLNSVYWTSSLFADQIVCSSLEPDIQWIKKKKRFSMSTVQIWPVCVMYFLIHVFSCMSP